MGIVFLRVDKNAKAQDLRLAVNNLWNTCRRLQQGIVKDIEIPSPEQYDDLTVLLGYGEGMFTLDGITKRKPRIFSDQWSFRGARKGGAPIYNGSELKYGAGVIDNHAGSDDLVVQFISNNSSVVNIALVELSREVLTMMSDEGNRNILSVTGFYTGFRRQDNRGWLGFHDGVSNMKEDERLKSISIDENQASKDESWIVNGTFMAFIRFEVDLVNWWKVSRNKQELMIGRDKTTGCPLVGVDKNQNPVMQKGCPIPGTRVVTDRGNEMFREHPPYGLQRLAQGISDETLKFSHIGAMRIIKKPAWKDETNRIFRQGYEFLEPTDSFPGFRAGLNFISFQNNLEKFFRTMTEWRKQENNHATLELNSYFTVLGAGVFLVPPLDTEENFPGETIFLGPKRFSTEQSTYGFMHRSKDWD